VIAARTASIMRISPNTNILALSRNKKGDRWAAVAR